MSKEMESLQISKVWKLAELLMGKKTQGCIWVYRKKQPPKKVAWPRGLAERDGVLFKSGLMLKFKRCFDLSDTCGL